MTLDEQVGAFEKAHVRYYSTDGVMVDTGTFRTMIRKLLTPEPSIPEQASIAMQELICDLIYSQEWRQEDLTFQSRCRSEAADLYLAIAAQLREESSTCESHYTTKEK